MLHEGKVKGESERGLGNLILIHSSFARRPRTAAMGLVLRGHFGMQIARSERERMRGGGEERERGERE